MFLIDCKKYNISNSVATKAKTKNDSLQSIRGLFGYLFESFWKPFFTGFFEGLSSSVAVPLRVCVCVCWHVRVLVLVVRVCWHCCVHGGGRGDGRTISILSNQSIFLCIYLSIYRRPFYYPIYVLFILSNLFHQLISTKYLFSSVLSYSSLLNRYLETRFLFLAKTRFGNLSKPWTFDILSDNSVNVPNYNSQALHKPNGCNKTSRGPIDPFKVGGRRPP